MVRSTVAELSWEVAAQDWEWEGFCPLSAQIHGDLGAQYEAISS